MKDEQKAKSIIPYQEKGYIFDEGLHEIYFHANGELMVKASVVEELKAKIEKMKCCGNCSKSCFAQDCEDIVNRCDYATSDSLLFKCGKWEMNE